MIENKKVEALAYIEGGIMKVELGEIKGGIPVMLRAMELFLLVTDKALVILSLPKRFWKILVLPKGLDKIMEGRALVTLAKLERNELIKKIREYWSKCKVLGFIKKEDIKVIEFHKKLFGFGAIAMKIHTYKGDKIDLTLIYGTGTGWSDKEAFNHAIKLLSNLNVKIEKKFK